MYLGYQNGVIKFYTQKPLDEAVYRLDRVEETDDEYILDGDRYVLKTQDVIDRQNNAIREKEILARLKEIDEKSIRAIRANDTEYLQKYENEAISLREELKGIANGK